MKVRFFKPFDEIAGDKEIDLALKEAMPVKELLAILADRIPAFKPYVRREGDEVQSFFVILVRGDEILHLPDLIQDGDVVRVLPPISGG
jgi:molybdopterin converting factor small subunit